MGGRYIDLRQGSGINDCRPTSRSVKNAIWGAFGHSSLGALWVPSYVTKIFWAMALASTGRPALASTGRPALAFQGGKNVQSQELTQLLIITRQLSINGYFVQYSILVKKRPSAACSILCPQPLGWYVFNTTPTQTMINDEGPTPINDVWLAPSNENWRMIHLHEWTT